jgi:hypothetical protein
MTADPQAMFVVEFPCDQFCSIEVDVSGERGQLTLQQMREKAEQLHQQIHEPERTEPPEPAAERAAEPAAEPESTGRPAATVFLSAPGRNGDRRR